MKRAVLGTIMIVALVAFSTIAYRLETWTAPHWVKGLALTGTWLWLLAGLFLITSGRRRL
jgi:hypothetical protein